MANNFLTSNDPYNLNAYLNNSSRSLALPPGGIPLPTIPTYNSSNNYGMQDTSLAINGGNLPSINNGYGGDASGFNWGGAFKNFNQGAQGLLGLAGAYNSYQQNRLMKDQYRTSLADRNQNVANQANITNKNLSNQASVAAQMMGYHIGTPEYQDYINKNQIQVDGSAIR